VQTDKNGDKGLDSKNWIPVVSNHNMRTNVHMRSAFRRNQPTIVMKTFTVTAQHENSTSCNDNNLSHQSNLSLFKITELLKNKAIKGTIIHVRKNTG
jgi:hypothetical protein